MAPKNSNIWTLSSLGNGNSSDEYPEYDQSGSGKSPSVRPQAAAASSSNAGHPATSSPTNFPFKVCCIPKLANEKEAVSLLHRVVGEFQPIIVRRGYNVRSISEMCCCHDGLDFEPNSRRKRRIMASNIWGYNQTSFYGGGKSHTIHIRLRHPTDHSRLLLYEDVAGTLAHELSHCEHGPHDAKFYKLMDEILEEHSTLMASQLRNNGAPMAAFTGAGHTVGSVFTGTGNRLGSSTSIGSSSNNGSKQPSNARDLRGYTLGGDSTFTTWMTPAEAAVAAAEARRRQQQLRLRGDHCCRPCTIEISDNDDVDNEMYDYETAIAVMESQQPPQQAAATTASATTNTSAHHGTSNSHSPLSLTDCIDLTGNNDTLGGGSGEQTWACRSCTFLNGPFSLECEMCETQRTNFP